MPLLMISAMGAVLLFWAIVVAAGQGWGILLLWLVRQEQASKNAGGFQLFWIGFATLLGLLQIWHLFLPVDWVATVVLLGAGVAAWCAKGIWQTWRPGAMGLSYCAILMVLGLWLANRGLDFASNYDSGLYHFATIRWITEYPVIPGLANLHARLGFNQSFFLFVALLNVHPYFNEGYHVANSLLVFVLSAQMLRATVALIREPSKASVPLVLQCLLLPVAMTQGLGGNISSPSPDLGVFVCGIVVFVSLVEMLATPVAKTGALSPSAWVLIALTVASCTLKLSFAVFGCAILCAAFWPGGKTRSLAAWSAIAGCAALMGVPYAIHGFILSGYPAFPMTLSPWPADWRLPLAETQDTANWVYSWARQPGHHWSEVLGTWSWLGPWWTRTKAMPQVFFPLTLAGAGAVLFAASMIIRPAKRNELTWWWRPFLPVSVGLLWWFFSAPDPRFADWLIWISAVWSLTCAIWLNRSIVDFPIMRTLAVATVAATVSVVAIRPSIWLGVRGHGFAWIPQPRTKIFTTESGLKITIPANDEDVRLWNTALPAAPHAKLNLELRGNGLREGFRTHIGQ